MTIEVAPKQPFKIELTREQINEFGEVLAQRDVLADVVLELVSIAEPCDEGFKITLDKEDMEMFEKLAENIRKYREKG